MTPAAATTGLGDLRHRHVPVVVIGGGPTGVTAATLLDRYGVDTLVLDRWTQVYPQPRAVHLDDEIHRILAAVGIADAFAAISRPARGLRLVDRRLRVLAEFTRSTAASVNGYPTANMFDQPELETLLRANLTGCRHVRLRGGVEVLGVTPDANGRTRIRLSDRDTGEECSLTADFVLGCDGANSVVRSAIGATMRSFRFDQRWLVVDIATTADLQQWDGVHQVCDTRRAATYMRIGASRYRWEFALHDHETAEDFATLPALQPLLAPWLGGSMDSALEVVRVAEYTFRAQLADRWRSERVFLLGDAAHLTPPFIGQGMGAGLRDAMNLAWKVAAVHRGWLPETVLDSYERERRHHARQLILTALAVGHAMTSGGHAADVLRALVVPHLHRLPGVRARIVGSETPALRSSSLLRRSGRGRRAAGRLCPNAVLTGGRRLDEEIGPGFAVLARIPLTAAQSASLERRGAAVVDCRDVPELATWLRTRGVTAAVVRPDRTVMAAGRDVDALCRAVPAFRAAEACRADRVGRSAGLGGEQHHSPRRTTAGEARRDLR